MNRRNKRLTGVVIILTAIFLVPGCNKLQLNTGESGFLEGVITIGPICPVERIPPDPACLPTIETYKAYPVSVWTADGNRKIKQIIPDLNGTYRTELAPGKYLVILEKELNRIGGSNLPINVTIRTKDYSLLNVDIDTGIR